MDAERERQRLAEEYSNMTEAKLKEFASEYADLTDLARKALKAEMERRGLSINPEDPTPTTGTIEDSDLVTIRTFRDLPEALLAKGLLESAGIECFLTDDNMVRLDWFISNAFGNMRLQVNRDDSEAAMEILDQPTPDDAENEE